MFTFLWIVAAVVVLFGIWKLSNSRFFKKLFEVGDAKLNKMADDVAKHDPVAVLKLRRDQEVETLQSNVGYLKDISADLESLIDQVARDEQENRRLESLVRKHKDNNPELAERYALDLARQRERYHTDVKQRDSLQVSFDKYQNNALMAQNAVEDLDSEIRMLASEVKASELGKRSAESMSNMSVGMNMSGIEEAKAEVRNLIARNRGAIKVTEKMNQSGFRELQEKEDERKEKARAILAEFDTPKSPVSNS